MIDGRSMQPMEIEDGVDDTLSIARVSNTYSVKFVYSKAKSFRHRHYVVSVTLRYRQPEEERNGKVCEIKEFRQMRVF